MTTTSRDLFFSSFDIDISLLFSCLLNFHKFFFWHHSCYCKYSAFSSRVHPKSSHNGHTWDFFRMKPKQVNHYVREFIPYFQLPASGGRKWRHRVGICRWWAITHAHFTKLKPREDGPMANSAHAWYAEKEWEARGLKLWIIAGVNKRARGACRWRCCLQGSDATPWRIDPKMAALLASLFFLSVCASLMLKHRRWMMLTLSAGIFTKRLIL